MSLELWYSEAELCSNPLGPDSPSQWSAQLHDSDGCQSPPAVVPSRADQAQQLLDDLEEYAKEEDSFSNWFEEEKTTLRIFDDLQTVSSFASSPISSTIDLTSLTTVTQSNFVKEEITYTLGHGHLTPPQSPPATISELALDGAMLFQQPGFVACSSEYVQEAYLLPTSPEVEREMAVVDEVVRGVAQQWEHLECSDSSSRSSSDGNSPDESDDPEWEPVAVASKATGRRTRRSRPYTVQDRRQRKKEQNKNAATRYRLKKKAEVNTIVDEERILEEKNTSLCSKVTEMEKEISYLKGLMREMFRAKGLVK